MSTADRQATLGVLGLGKLGGILLAAFLEEGLVTPNRVVATVGHDEHVPGRVERFGIEVSTDNRAAAERADVLILCVKPPTVAEVCRQIAPALDASKLLISVAAAVPTSAIEGLVGTVPVIRAMPNTPTAIGHGMTALSPGAHAGENDLARAQGFFDAVGRTVVLDERYMNAVTGLSASGPAFVYVILESLAEAGVKVGLPRDVATLLAAQTTLGAAGMVLETGSHPALLKDAVTTPAGCTIDGLLELEEGGLRVTLIKAVVQAVETAGQLAGD